MADDVLKNLQELASVPELTTGFKNQQECIAWGNKVLIQLAFNSDIQNEFMGYQQNINTMKLSADLQASSLNMMISLIGIAIGERQKEINNQPKKVSDELLEYADSFEEISKRFIQGSTHHLDLEDETLFKQQSLEVISLIRESLGDKNQYSGTIVLTLNNDTGTYGPSKHCVFTVKGIVLAAQKEVKRKESQGTNGGDMFNHLLTDTVSIVKKNGETHHGIKAAINKDFIHINYETVEINKGDKIRLNLPNRPVQIFVVDDPGFQSKKGWVTAYYKIKYIKEENIPPVPVHNTFHVSGNNAKVNFNSTDNSTNIVNNSSSEIFDNLITLVKEQIEEGKDRESLIATINAMNETQGTSGFKDHYINFISFVSNHITVLGPILPTLKTFYDSVL